MKKLFAILFILFSIGTLSAQNLNFTDTNGLKTLLCSHTSYRYYVNPDSSFSDRVMDSIKFYPNRTYYESARKNTDSADWFLPKDISTGTWFFGGTGKIRRSDSASNCININLKFTKRNGIILSAFTLVDWQRIRDTRYRKISGNLDQPFLVYTYYGNGIDWDKREIWQPRREIKKAKKH